ncbi:MAG TPA: hypothetical protein VM370_07180 [Candidatus Thermoplasmatota archaeon]|nr:hypothetical protein [Candidatus Thermoplasmatota archaeon]
MSTAGGQHPYTDVSGRMEVFGKLFGEQVGVPEPTSLPNAHSLMAVVRARVPRDVNASEDAPVFEAAAFVGEWLRRRADALWVAEGPFEPHLQLVDPTHAIVYLLPLVQLIRTAATAGYDGMTHMIERVLADVSQPAEAVPLSALRVVPTEEREAVVLWARANRDVRDATRAALWRRCSVCSRIDERAITLQRPGSDWEGEAANAAHILAANPFQCPCGGPPGATSRFLMMRHHEDATRLGDIHVTNTHTRVGCWTLLDADMVAPFDALALSQDEMLMG